MAPKPSVSPARPYPDRPRSPATKKEHAMLKPKPAPKPKPEPPAVINPDWNKGIEP